jgi:hypothetical protein
LTSRRTTSVIDFLVGRADDEVALVAVLEAQQFRAVFRSAPGFFPQFEGLYCRHQQFDGPGAVHFLAHDVFDLAQHAQAHRHPGVDATRQATDQSGAQHQLVADDFGVGGSFLEGGDEELAGAHGCGRKIGKRAF